MDYVGMCICPLETACLQCYWNHISELVAPMEHDVSSWTVPKGPPTLLCLLTQYMHFHGGIGTHLQACHSVRDLDVPYGPIRINLCRSGAPHRTYNCTQVNLVISAQSTMCQLHVNLVMAVWMLLD